MHPIRLVAASLLVLAGCAAVTDAPDPPIPAHAAQIRVYTEGGEGGNGIPETVRWTIDSLGAVAESGVVTPTPEATCIVVGSQWNLSIDDDGRQVPLDRFRSAQFSGVSPLDLKIVRDAMGRITVTEGLPNWMNGKPLGCAPLDPN